MVTADTSIGQQVRCPHCNLLLLVPDVRPAHVKAGVPALVGGPLFDDDIPDLDAAGRGHDDYDDDYGEDRPRRRKKKKGRSADRGKLKVVSVGLLLLYIVAIAYLGLFVLNFLNALLRLAVPQVAAVFSLLLSGLGLLVLVMGLVGCVLCCFAPAKSRAAPMMMWYLGVGILVPITLGLLLLIFVGGTAALANSGLRVSGESVGVMGIMMLIFCAVTVLAMMFSMIWFFYTYLTRLADYLHEDALSSEADMLMKTSFALPIFYIAIFVPIIVCALLGVPQVGFIIAGLLALGLLIYILILLVRVILLLGGLRAAVAANC